MCGLFELVSDPERLRRAFRIDGVMAPLRPRPLVRPGEPVAIIRREEDGRRHLRLALWRFIPHWMRTPPRGRQIINARAESLLEKPAFRGPVRYRRCILPADAFYEWTGTPGHKVAFRFTARNGDPLAMAGLWDRWQAPDGGEIETAVIITVKAGPDVAPVHDRMPALLAGPELDAWLDPATSARAAVSLLRPAPAGSLQAREAGNPFRSLSGETPRLL
jgi:putative SOS response-associated peptidase YedK